MAKQTLKQQVEAAEARAERAERALGDLRARVQGNSGPMQLTISVDRLTGRFSRSLAIDQANPEAELRLLAEAVRQVEAQIQADIQRLIEERMQRQMERRIAEMQQETAPGENGDGHGEA